jgi:hypothetical protein
VHCRVNSKVVDHVSLYNFYNGRQVFWSMVWAGTCKVLVFMAPMNSKFFSWPSLSPFSTQNLKCHSTWKLCPSKNWTTFILGDFEVFRWNLQNAAKVPEDVQRHWGFRWGLTMPFTKVDHNWVLTWSRGSLEIVGEVFEVRTQVDHGLTNVCMFDSAIRSLALMTLIKNLGRHTSPSAYSSLS